jgi:DNA-binding transcriptional ArsR family regulator
MVEYSAHSLDATYRALAHPIRRRMLERLAADGSRVTRLAAGFGISLAAASKHIRVLEAAGLIHRTVIGREHHLSLRAEPLTEAAAWIERSQRFWNERVDGLDAVLRDGPV